MSTLASQTPVDDPVESFALGGWHGEFSARFQPKDLEAEVGRLVDPAAAEETIHWGRNYLYRTRIETAQGMVPVVVKQFRNLGRRARLRQRLGGSKGLRSWRMARAFQAAGVPTAAPVLLIESDDPTGPSFFVTEHLEDVVEARYILRAVREDRLAEAYPDLDFESFLESTGRVLRKMHDEHLFHRDLSIGNVLLSSQRPGPEVALEDLHIIDLNRARQRRLGWVGRTRDLCRLSIFENEHRKLFLKSYWGEEPGFLRTGLYLFFHYGFLFKVEGKKAVRSRFRRLLQALRPRRAHPHIPAADPEASARDKIVWDYLSDQPHQHAGRWEKLSVRLRDAPNHLRNHATFLAATPRIWRRYRQLMAGLDQKPVPWDGVGLCVRPYPPAPEKILQALDDLDVRKVLLRLHPWEDDHQQEEDLARELHGRGYDLVYALPQNRDLVRDPARWRTKIEELAERFTPWGRHYQVGQAINRSKWGVWRYDEYLNMANEAAEILRRHPGVEVLGPAVIDFELQATAAVVNLPKAPRFDALASLLYVDRRGAPENTQLGFDTVGKVALLQAIAETARRCGPRSWITEVNWPLWEGPHSPAGRSVSVNELEQAQYLARYYLLALSTGLVERVYWWQLVARGYGLITAEEDPRTLRRRPAFEALRTLERELRGSRYVGTFHHEEGLRSMRFDWPDGRECVVAWSLEGPRSIELPRPPTRLVEIDGLSSPVSKSLMMEILPSVRYFHL